MMVRHYAKAGKRAPDNPAESPTSTTVKVPAPVTMLLYPVPSWSCS